MAIGAQAIELEPVDTPLAPGEWRRFWPVVLAAGLGFSFNSVITQAIGLFIKPLTEAFGWSHTLITAGLPISTLLGIVLSPLFGSAVDRWGVRRLGLTGLACLSLAYVGFGQASGSHAQWIALWVFYACVGMMVTSAIWVTAVSTVFHRNRSLTIATVLSGAALAQIVVPPLSERLIAGFGWRVAFTTLGLGWGGIAFVMSLLFLYDARDRIRMSKASAADHGLLQRGLTLGQALRSTAFLRIAVAAFVSMMMGVAVIVHQVPILTATGVTRQNAALLASVTGIAALAGKLSTGWLMDRADAGVVGAVTLALSALGFPMLLDQFRSVPLIILAMFLIGYAGGTKLQVCAYLTGRYVGLRNYGRIFGAMSSIIALGSGIGPFLASAIFDKTGSYTIFLIVGGLGTLAISPLILGLGPYPDWSSDQTAR